MASLRRRTLLYLSALAVPLALGVLVPVTLIQALLNRSLQMYERNQQYQVAADLVGSLEEHLQEYLETKSTDSLRTFLEVSDQLQGTVALFSATSDIVPSGGRGRHLERSAHFMIRSLLETADRAVQAKRGRSPEQYTQLFTEVRVITGLLQSDLIELSQQELTRVMQSQERFSVEFGRMQLLSFSFLMSLMFMTAGLASVFAGKIAEPISRLSGSALRLADGDFSVPDIPLRGSNEVQHMAQAFNRMKASIQRNIKELQRTAEIEKGLMEERVSNLRMKNVVKQAEMTALQSQIRPHFLFNALNAGVQLATIEDADRTSEYLDALAHLFRETLRPLSEASTLGREYDTLRSFLYIMQIRFGGLVELQSEIDTSTLSLPLPRLILQPLVENSILHGFQDGNGSIRLRSWREDTRAVIELSDNGCGMHSDTAHKVRREATSWNPEMLQGNAEAHNERSGIGIRNVMYRMRLFSGLPDCFELDTAPGSGVCIRLRLPLPAFVTAEGEA